ncbi:uncharacterized protein LOC119369209 [Jatropha curcas]|uniref:uncharacterized protein LOC119369209 n=1 Tax=Jatropha curcas TaxID=180498 RepID=UPI001893037E|nr:uncharacterized protein LOC119369209 [Jatropha curcas]
MLRTSCVGPGLRQVDHPKFVKSYSKTIDRENPYPKGYRNSDFTLFFEEDGQSTVKHITRFTIQCGELVNLENFANYKLRLFSNSLTGTAFTQYSTLMRNSINSWYRMERLFHTQFFRAKPEVCMAKLSMLTQRSGEMVNSFIARFKKLRNRSSEDPNSSPNSSSDVSKVSSISSLAIAPYKRPRLAMKDLQELDEAEVIFEEELVDDFRGDI